ncbi:MAG: PQQ-binding-like beta-propeller repeat protein [Bacteroidetes bacterium]|nr:PQQ-binding-like beta-propeller repeat protein [Bacteroidota bacterium]
MKKQNNLFLALCVSIFFTYNLYSQKEFQQIYKSKFPISVDSRGISKDRDYCWGTDWKNLSMMDAKTGTILWTVNFKEKFDFKKASSYEFHDDKNVLEIVKEEKDVTKSYYFDAKTGKVIDNAEFEKIKVEKQKKVWFSKFKSKKIGIGEIEKDGSTISLTYKRRVLTGSMKPSETTATITSSGKNSWQQSINVKVVRNLFPSGYSDGGSDFITMYETAGKIFVLYEGLTVLDFNTGKVLWTSTFDNSTFDFGVFKSTQELGRAAWPLAINDAVYIVDLSKENRCIKKVNIENGNVIWKIQDKLDKDEIIPNISVSGNVLFAQFGGLIEKQIMINSDKGTTYKREFRYDGNFGVKAYDINTGKLLWDTHSRESEFEDKFKGAITNLFLDNGKVFVGSSKNIYSFDASSGKVLFKTPVKDLKLGYAENIWSYKNALIVESEKGIASVDMGSGKLNYGTKTGKCLGTFDVGDAFYVWNGKNKEVINAFVRLDLNTGNITGKIEDTGNPKFSDDGNEFVKFDGAKVFRFKTN